MAQESTYEWVPFYMELADRLLPYRKNRGELLELTREAHAQAGMNYPTIDYGEPTDVDPFTVFGMFNKQISRTNRTKLLAALGGLLGMEATVPTSFEGIPLVNNMSVTFYAFGDERGENDIDYLWDAFEAALAFANEDTPQTREAFVKAYDAALAVRQVKWNLTMGLFWVRPLAFVSLDSRNRWFADDQKMLGEECAAAVHALGKVPPSGAKYLQVNDLMLSQFDPDGTYADSPTFSWDAWETSQRINKQKAAQKKAAAQKAAEKGKATLGDEGVRTTKYWMVTLDNDSSLWNAFLDQGVIAIGWDELGDLASYADKGEAAKAIQRTYGKTGSLDGDTLIIWQFANEMRPGDVVYLKRGAALVVGRGIVRGEYERRESREGLQNVHMVEWTTIHEDVIEGMDKMEMLVDVTSSDPIVRTLERRYGDGGAFSEPATPEPADPDDEDSPTALTPYSREDFLADVYMDAARYDRLVSLLRHKMNVILQGAPGVGKTYMAKRLAYSMMGEKDPSRVELVQFHQSYSYEDLVMGYRPVAEGFELREGSFYRFCRRAEEDPEHDYFFLIDEVNRANLSKVFGELFMLIEADKRGYQIRLMYSDELFCVPANVYIVGMMNTADRSLAMMDFALRRRFAFFEVEPGFGSEGFRTYQAQLRSPTFDRLVACVQQLNADIEADESLGRGFRVGHSFFCDMEPEDVDQRLPEVVEYELVPLLEEYWYDDQDRAASWAARLRDAIR